MIPPAGVLIVAEQLLYDDLISFAHFIEQSSASSVAYEAQGVCDLVLRHEVEDVEHAVVVEVPEDLFLHSLIGRL
jgi:hypothetical protein